MTYLVFHDIFLNNCLFDRYEVMKNCFESDDIGDYQLPEWQLIMDYFSRFLMIISSSINIIIYTWSGEEFKQVLFATLRLTKVVE